MSIGTDADRDALCAFFVKTGADPVLARSFVTMVSNSEALAAYAAAKGVELSAVDADKIYGALAAVAKRTESGPSGASPISDDELADVSGGGFFDSIGDFLQDIFTRNRQEKKGAVIRPV